MLGLAFALPVGQLSWWAAGAVADRQVAPDFAALLGRTGALAAITALAACALAVVLGYAGRLHATAAVRVSSQLAAMGYALPGAMIAVGVLLPLAWLDHRIAPLVERAAGVPVGMLLTGSAFGLILAYVIRFLAVALQTVEASLTKISPSLDDAARSLGTSHRRRAPARAPAHDPRRHLHGVRPACSWRR